MLFAWARAAKGILRSSARRSCFSFALATHNWLRIPAKCMWLRGAAVAGLTPDQWLGARLSLALRRQAKSLPQVCLRMPHVAQSLELFCSRGASPKPQETSYKLQSPATSQGWCAVKSRHPQTATSRDLKPSGLRHAHWSRSKSRSVFAAPDLSLPAVAPHRERRATLCRSLAPKPFGGTANKSAATLLAIFSDIAQCMPPLLHETILSVSPQPSTCRFWENTGEDLSDTVAML